MAEHVLEMLETFASHAFLRGLGEQHLLTLAGGVQPFTAPPGQYLGRQGAPAADFYLIQSGHVAVESRTPENEAVFIQTVRPGEVVGWSALLPPYRWHFDFRAVGQVQGLRFHARWLLDRCDEDQDLGYRLFKYLLSVSAGQLTATRFELQERASKNRPEPSALKRNREVES